MAKATVYASGLNILPSTPVKVKIGKNTIINSGAIVEHGSVIGDHCHVAPGAIILGDVSIGSETFVGAGTVVREGVSIAAQSFVPAMTMVKNDWEVSRAGSAIVNR